MTLFRKKNSNPCWKCAYFQVCGDYSKIGSCKGQKKFDRKTINAYSKFNEGR